jgi:sugar lactone lactonase YvrE
VEGNWNIRLIRWNTALILFISLTILPALASSEEVYKFERMWPTLQQPWYIGPGLGIAVDADNNIYVGTLGPGAVQKFTADGQFITKWGITEYTSYLGIALDGSGNVYVVDTLNERIRKFTSDGQLITEWGSPGNGDGEFQFLAELQPEWPQFPIWPWFSCGIAIDASGNVYVVDGGNHRIQKFTPEGQFIAKWGSQGSDDGLFINPSGAAIDASGNVYVVDTGNYRIQKFTPEGQFIAKWGSQGSGDGEFDLSKGIAIDVNGNVYVADTLNERIQKFTQDGQFITKWGGPGPGDGEFHCPEGIAIDASGNVYIANVCANWRIQKFTPDGQFIASWGTGSEGDGEFIEPEGIAADASGNVYVTDWGRRIQKFTPDGQFITKWGEPGPGDGEFSGLRSIAIDASGNVYVTESGNNRVQKFTPEGQFITKWGSEGSGNGEFIEPRGITADASGNIYVVDAGNNRIQKFTPEGQFITKWGSYGQGDGEFDFVMDDNVPIAQIEGDIAVDVNGNVYVIDVGNHRIQKFTSDGQFITKWGQGGPGDANIHFPRGIAIDASGNVCLIDFHRPGIQKFTSEGQFIELFGEGGSDPGQMNGPYDLCIGLNQRIYVTESANNRIQVFSLRDAAAGIFKAIVVAGGGPYAGNNLWDATQLSANFAYRTLTYQGFTKETIYYLTSDTDLDLDNNGVLDDVDGDATNSNLEQAITTWAADADNLIVYLVDHGGSETFRMSGTETLPASELDSWLDSLQSTLTGKVIIVYDACESGSFISALTPPSGKERFVITSTSPGENAYFVSQGSVSFSNYFLTQVFNGLNVKDAFDLATDAIGHTTDSQHPLVDANGNGVSNEAEDYTLVQNTYIGNGTVIYGDAPVVGGVSDPQTISGTSSALLSATGVTDSDGIARVWAVIRPPDYNQGSSDNPVQELPSIDLMPVGGDQYQATYENFNTEGTYQIAIYARDRIGNTCVPQLTTVTGNDPLTRKAILVAGGSQSDELWPAIEKTATLVYESLTFQGYTDEDIYFMSPVTFSAGVDALATLSNLSYAINTWAQTSTQDVVLYLLGNGDHETFEISQTETLAATTLDSWLDNLQSNISGKVTVIYDGCRAGSFLPSLTPPVEKERILLASTGANQPAYFLLAGDISFSKFFWTKVLNGANVRESFLHAKNAIAYACPNQTPNLDDNGNGIGNEKLDGQLARNYTIGVGIILAGDDPVIGSISPEQTLHGQTSATIWVEGVTTTGSIDKVWAVITPPGYGTGSPSDPVTDSPTVTLAPVGNGRYEGTYSSFTTFGTYDMAVYAMDTDGNISLPKETRVSQAVGPDVYEEDDTSSQATVIVLNDVEAQRHTLHDGGDQDWVMFYGLSGETYTIEVSNLGTSCDAVVELYGTDGTTLLDSRDDGLSGEDELLDWLSPAEGVYYVKVKHYDSDIFGEDTEYDLQVYSPIGPLAGFLLGTTTNKNSGDPIGGVRIKTSGKVSALSLADGNYLMVHPPGSHSLTAEVSGYESFTDTVTITEAGTVTKNISMTPLDFRGDIDGDLDVDLTDAILAFQVMAGIQSSTTIYLEADVNNDNKIGLEEVLYILQHVAGFR